MIENENYKFLLEIGFTLNESKVYLTLLQNRYLNGYEISKFSNVSRSLVYNVIDRLVAKGFVLKSEGQINYYCALPYDKVIEKIRNDNINKLNVAREKLKNYSRIENESEYIFNIKGIDEFFSKANDLILNAEKEISISIWKEDFPKIEESLSIASKKGIKIYIFSFSDITFPSGEIFSYQLKNPTALFPYRRISIVVDGKEVIIGENAGDKSICVLSKNHALVSMTTDEIVLNIFWLKYIKSKGLLNNNATSDEFLSLLNKLREDLGVSPDMTKNYLVFNFQFGGKDYGSNKDWKTTTAWG